jgi:hypothetical protein
MPFNFDFLANVIFFIIGIYNIIYLFLVVSFTKEFKGLVNSIIPAKGSL